MEIKSVIIICIAIVAISGRTKAKVLDDYCYASDKQHLQNAHFNSLTAYDLIRGTDLKTQTSIPNCEATKIWMIIRHGTRMPRPNSISHLIKLEDMRDEIIKNFDGRENQLTGDELCLGDIELLKRWHFDTNMTMNTSNLLTESGWKEIQGIASRFQATYPHLINQTYDSSKFVFRSCQAERMYKSFEAFADGIFGQNAHKNVHADADDSILIPYNHCPAWKRLNGELRGQDSEPWTFLVHYTRIAEEVSKRLGFETLLGIGQISDMFNMCSYETALNPAKPSAWCAAFTPKHVKWFEYFWDLLYYMGAGYRLDVNTRIMGDAVADMINHLESRDMPEVIVSFGRSNSLKTFFTTLGVAKNGIPLRADNYDKVKGREWRVSKLWPFGCNFAAIKHECKNEDDKVMLLLNEKRFGFDECKNGFCALADLKQKYQHFLGGDNDKVVQSMCQNHSPKLSKFSVLTLISFIVTLQLFSE